MVTVRIDNCPDRDGVYVLRDGSGTSRVIEAHADYFPDAVPAAVPNPGDTAFFEAEYDPETREYSFGEQVEQPRA